MKSCTVGQELVLFNRPSKSEADLENAWPKRLQPRSLIRPATHLSTSILSHTVANTFNASQCHVIASYDNTYPLEIFRTMAQLPGTPKSPSDPQGHHHASYLPRDIPYSSTFEDEIASLLLTPPSDPSPGVSAPSSPSSLPSLDLSSLPLPITDPRRKYPSPIPGLLLTHPGGYLEGGPGISPSEDEFAGHFVAEHGIRDADTLRRVVEEEIEKQVEVARERARARRRAREKNEGIESEVRAMEEQLQLEMRVLGKARERARERRERRERKRG